VSHYSGQNTAKDLTLRNFQHRKIHIVQPVYYYRQYSAE